ncbi:hypothetical protein HS7_05540 [Sulfolobales archaeon HS-7]|nr:hypothetical protein HS7_05540 [Sulfolobales archaeon HS-7]
MLRVLLDLFRDPYWNMAVDEAMLNKVKDTGKLTLRIYGWQPYAVSLGRGQKMMDTVDLELAKNMGLKIVRRPTGGGALIHSHEITYSVIAPPRHELLRMDVESSAIYIANGIAKGLRKLGIKAEVRGFADKSKYNLCYMRVGASDVIVDDLKISGSAQTRKDGLLQHGTLLLSISEEEWNVIKGADISGKLTYLNNYGNFQIDEIITALISGFSEIFGDYEFGSLTPIEVKESIELYQHKYSRSEWNTVP